MILASNFCEETVNAWKIVGTIILIIKIVVPLLITIMGTISLINVVTKGTTDELFSAVKSKGMLNNTIFQTDEEEVVSAINSADNNARIWFLNSSSTSSLKTNSISSLKDKLEGVNMIATSVTESDINTVHGMGLKMCAFSYTSFPYGGKSAATLKSWGVDYLMANDIGN